MTEKKAVAIITARGGSKRIPGKNIREFCGKPILAYSIEAALASRSFDEVMVSTEDEKIARLAETYGAAVPFMRSEEAANDYATTVDVLEEVLSRYRQSGRIFDELCCIYPTAPFVTADKLRRAMRLLDRPETDAVMPVIAFSFPPMRGMYIQKGRLTYCYPEYCATRSQDLEPVYHDCGQFYCIKTEALLRERSLVPVRTEAIIMPESEAQDIDTEEDWKLAEIKYRLWKGGDLSAGGDG